MGEVNPIHYSQPRAHIALLEIDNPPMNALGRVARAALLARLDEIDTDGNIRVVVLTGRGARAFCCGDDLKEQAEAQKTRSSAHLGEFGRVLERIEHHRLPVIAAINGWCLGGGLELASVCDIRIASDTARFVCSGVNVGLMASAYRLPRLIGVARAKHMLLTGSPVDAATADKFGLVTAVHALQMLVSGSNQAGGTDRQPRAPVGGGNQALRLACARPVAAEAAATNAKELAVLARSADHKAALGAFAEKREPVFKRG